MEKAGRIIFRASGFALLQSLIGAAIVAITSMVLLSVVANLSTLSNKYIVKEELTTAAQTISKALVSEDVCSKAFNTAAGTPLRFNASNGVTVPQIVTVDSAGTITPLMQSQSRFRERIFIGDIFLYQMSGQTGQKEMVYSVDSGGNITRKTYDTYVAQLMIPTFRGTQVADAIAANQLPNQEVPLKLFVDPATRDILRCFSLASDNQICGSFGGTVSPAGRCILPRCADDPGDTDPYNPITQAPHPIFGPPKRCARPDPRKTSCTPPAGQWLWVFKGGDAAATPPVPSRPECICIQSCP